jgi:subtilisin family serine protease
MYAPSARLQVRMTVATFFLILITGALVLASGAVAAPAAVPVGGSLAVRGRLLVRFAPSVEQSAAELLSQGRSFESVTGSPALDQLNDRFGIRGAQSLVVDRENLGGADASRLARQRFDDAAARFPDRTRRAPADLQAPDLSNLYILTFHPRLDLARAAQAYRALPEVIYAEPDWVVSLSLVPDDPFFSSSGTWGQGYGDLWGPPIVNAPTAWDTATGAGITIAVVDSGIDATHPELAGQLWTNPGEIAANGIDDDLNGFVDDVKGWDFLDDDDNPDDVNGHGTHVAGTAVAAGNNGVGVIGMAFGARAMPVRAFGLDGTAVTSDLVESVIYAAENGADILNASWSGDASQALSDAIATARALGVVVVAAAGNDSKSTTGVTPANEPGVITVSATDPLDQAAIFTNFGSDVNLAAPGVDILSAKSSKAVGIGGATVASNYLRLSGTSMATPHVAGAAAVLLEALPTLTANEVAWHLELNANQVEHPGYEGLDFNPYLGWGRLDAAAMFTSPPVVTRVDDGLGARHGFAGVLNSDVDLLGFSFSTETSVAWTLAMPAWLLPDLTAGSGNSSQSLAVDATGLPAGPLAVSITVDAPSTSDGGASTDATWWLHDDPRLIPPAVWSGVQAADDPLPGMASNGIGTMIVWQDTSAGSALRCVEVDNAANVSTPVTIHSGSFLGPRLHLAAGERDYALFVAQPSEKGIDLGVLRIGPGCVPLDDDPFVVFTQRSKSNTVFEVADLEFDGESFALMWRQTKTLGASKEKYALLRMSEGGVLQGKRSKIYPSGGLSSAIGAELECFDGSCLFFWDAQAGPQSTISSPFDFVSFELVGDGFVRRTAKDALDGLVRWDELAAGDGEYLAVGQEYVHCPDGPSTVFCRNDAVAARVTTDGDNIDFVPIQLNVDPDFETMTARTAVDAVWDGTNYNVLFRTQTDGDAEYVFAQRLNSSMATLEVEQEGALLFPTSAAISQLPLIVSDALHSVVMTTTMTPAEYEADPNGARSLLVTAVYAKAAPASFVEKEIGLIGDLVMDEGTTVSFSLLSGGLNPATTVFSATGLPEGAELEPTTGLFRFVANGVSEGFYPSVHIEAFDGATTISEDLTLTVNEAVLSLSGVVQNALDSSPAAGLALRLIGVRSSRPKAFTDAQGRYRFEGVPANDGYRVQLDNPSRRSHLADPRSVSIELLESDGTMDLLVVTPR